MLERQIGFGDAVRLGFRNYFNFSGRAQRSEYWWFWLFVTLGFAMLASVDGALFDTDPDEGGLLSGLFGLATFIPMLALGWRRLHDTGRSGFWILLPYATLIWVIAAVIVLGMDGQGGTVAIVAVTGIAAFLASIVYVIWMLVLDSDPYPNPWGESPKYGAPDVFPDAARGR